jgi:hypothetical protein
MPTVKQAGLSVGSALVGAGIATTIALSGASAAPVIEAETPVTDAVYSQLLAAVNNNADVALVNISVSDIHDQTEQGRFLGLNWKALDKRTILTSSFTAKLGIESEDVQIAKSGDTWWISIPEFEFLEYENPQFEVLVEKNGALSFRTPEVSEIDIFNEASASFKTDYLAKYDEALRIAAQDYYTQLFASIVPGESLHFTFAS